MTNYKKKSILLLSLIILIAPVYFSFHFMAEYIQQNSDAKLSLSDTLKLIPTYFLLFFSFAIHIFNYINNMIPVPRFILNINRKMSTYDLSSELVITNETKSEIVIENIQNIFYITEPVKIKINPESTERINIDLIYNNHEVDIDRLLKAKKLDFNIVYKTNNSFKPQKSNIKIKNIFYSNNKE